MVSFPTYYTITPFRTNSSSSSLRGVLAGDSPSSQATTAEEEEDSSLFYVGYYSQHEQSMQEASRQQTAIVEGNLSGVLKAATVHCRRDHLWQKMFTSTAGFDFVDLMELANLVAVEDVPTTGLSMSAKFSPSSSAIKGRYQVGFAKETHPACERNMICFCL